MSAATFPQLELDRWRTTRDTLHAYAKVLGQIRKELAPPQKHWWHISLRVSESGLTTAALPAPERSGEQFEVILDLRAHRLMITTTWGVWWEMPVSGQPPRVFCNQVLSALETMQIFLDFDREPFDILEQPYDFAAVEDYCQAITGIEAIFQRFKFEIPGETSPVQLWPHHFDLALMWLSGRKVPGVDPLDEENADEQISFGFSTGDEGVPDPYFYVTVYPWPDQITGKSLPPGAAWRTEGWKGALMMYETLVEASNPEEKLLHFLRAAHLAGATLLR